MFKKSSKIFAVLVIFALLASSFAGLIACSDDGDAIVIGVIAPTSGTNAQYGRDMFNSFQLAVDEINAAGGVLGRKLKLFEADAGGDPTSAVTATARVISHGVDFIAGGYASGQVTPTLQQIADENLIFLVANANSSAITEAGHTQTFMVNSTAKNQVAKLTELVRYLGVRNVALIHQGDSFTQNLAGIAEAELPKSGFNIATVQVVEENATDISATVTAILTAGADFVYWCGYDADGATVIRQLRNGGYTGEIAVADGSASVELIGFAGETGEGVYVTSPPFVRFAQGGEAFDAAYRAKFNNLAPGTYATVSYDVIYLLKAAIEKADSIETDKVRDALNEIVYNGLSGTINFTADREPELSNFIILQITNGDFQLVNMN